MDKPLDNLCILPMNFNQFIDWYRELGKLKIFWAKQLNSIKLVSADEEKCLMEIEWAIRKHTERAIMIVAKDSNKASEMLRKSSNRYLDATKLVMIPEVDTLNPPYEINARSILYFWSRTSNTLEPNSEVRIITLSTWSDDDVETFRQIHKRSWGFFIPPRREDHIVVLAYLNDAPVGMAYFNKNNFNIDYGIHVIRTHWRNRIGTRILRETLDLGKKLGAKHVSVVRVLRSLKISSSDKQAILFYRANNPFLRLNVYRMAE